MPTTLQTILLPLKKYKTLADAKAYIRKKGYKLSWRNKKPEKLGNFWHFRQGDKTKAGKKLRYFTHKKKGGEEYVFYKS